jgi:hypothetical protein
VWRRWSKRPPANGHGDEEYQGEAQQTGGSTGGERQYNYHGTATYQSHTGGCGDGTTTDLPFVVAPNREVPIIQIELSRERQGEGPSPLTGDFAQGRPTCGRGGQALVFAHGRQRPPQFASDYCHVFSHQVAQRV